MMPLETVFLDRDGTINEKPADGEYVLSPDQLQLLPGVAVAIRRLNDRGIRVVVVTNQRCVAKGLVSEVELSSIHRRLEAMLAAEGARLDGIYACPHEEGACECRKPRPGLFHAAQRADPRIDFARSVMIGDALSDLEAATAAGIRCVLLSPSDAALRSDHARDLPTAVAQLTQGH